MISDDLAELGIYYLTIISIVIKANKVQRLHKRKDDLTALISMKHFLNFLWKRETNQKTYGIKKLPITHNRTAREQNPI